MNAKKEARLKMWNDNDRGQEFVYAHGQVGERKVSTSLCMYKLTKHIKIDPTVEYLTLVATSKDPGGNDVFDLLQGGAIEGIREETQPGTTEWLARQWAAGRTFVQIELP